ncbi:MAG: hypothetical protein AB7U20_07295 [Planctomycetaceae bacterium]
MKPIIILVVIVLVAVLLGWMTFRNSGDTATISIDKQKIQQDAETAVESVKETVEDLQDRLDDGHSGAKAPHEQDSSPPAEAREADRSLTP